MASDVSALYEPLISRDSAGVPAAVRRFRESHDSDALFSAITRFAILAYAPSQHAKHAVLACLAAHELRPAHDGDYDALLTECAIYAAESRQPWSEPPISDPPLLTGRPSDLAELRAAIAASDRLRAEEWLAARLDDPALALDFFAFASEDLSDLGHKLIVAVAAWKLAALFDVRGRFATLRIAVREWTAYHGRAMAEPASEEETSLESLASRLTQSYIDANGSLVEAHALFLLEAAREARRLGAGPEVLQRTIEHLRALPPLSPAAEIPASAPAHVSLAYHFARDYGALLQMRALCSRFELASDDIKERMLDAAARNLMASDGEEMSFA